MKLILFSFVFPNLVWCFNLDPKFPVIITDPNNKHPDNYFGYAVQFYTKSDSIRLLIGAPKSYNPDFWDFSGAVYDCQFSDGGVKNCSQIKLHQNGKSEEHGGRFSDGKDPTDVWIGGALTVNEKTKLIAVCGAQKNMTHLLNGICYILPYSDERDHEEIYNMVLVLHIENKELPLVDDSQHRVLIPFYSLSESKVSVQSFDNEIIIGAPGMFYRNGTLKTYTEKQLKKSFRVSKFYFTQGSSLHKYFGHSVAGGNFFKSQGQFYVVPASRVLNSTGKVFVYKTVKEKNEWVPFIQTELEGEQYGEYFGQALCVVDLNKDGYDDILVGAPGHSEDDTIEKPTAEGKVYVFLSTGTGNFQKMDGLVGSKISGAKFGSAISSVGDLDYDGFPEIAVGAPYERVSSSEDNTGCIYIYKGGVNGVSTEHVQRIRSVDVGNGIKGFGISISKGLDVDGNNYNDISVGAYESGHVILIKSKPVVNVYYKVEIIPDPLIGRKYIFYSYNNDPNIFRPIIQQDSTKFQFKICLTYEGSNVPEDLDFDIAVTVDNMLQRAYFLKSTGKKNSTLSYSKAILEKGFQYCLPFYDVFLNFSNYENHSFQYSPLPITLHYTIAENPSTEFCATCPVINQTSYHVLKILLKPKCDNATSFPDWRITAEFPGIEEPFLVGSMDSIHLKIKVVNRGVWCTLKNLTIALPQNVSLKPVLTQCYEVSKNSWKCLEDAEVYSQQEIILFFELELKNLDIGSGSAQFKFFLFSYFEDASKKNDQTFELNLKLKEDHRFVLAAKANPSVYTETLERNKTVDFTHNYQIFMSGFTKIKIFYFRCEIQEKVLWKNTTLTLLKSHHFKATTDSGRVSCGKRDVASAGKMDAFQNLSVTDITLINDTNIKDTNFYHIYDCFAYNLEPNSDGIHAKINIHILTEALESIFKNSSVIQYNTSLKVFHKEKFEKSVGTKFNRDSIYSCQWLYYVLGVAIIVWAIIFVPVVICYKRRISEKRRKRKLK